MSIQRRDKIIYHGPYSDYNTNLKNFLYFSHAIAVRINFNYGISSGF